MESTEINRSYNGYLPAWRKPSQFDFIIGALVIKSLLFIKTVFREPSILCLFPRT